MAILFVTTYTGTPATNLLGQQNPVSIANHDRTAEPAIEREPSSASCSGVKSDARTATLAISAATVMPRTL